MGTARKLALLVGTVALIVAATPGVSAAAGAPLYLSIGDSAAAGVQPTGWMSYGYADQLAERAREATPDLRLLKLGCPGETTASLLTGAESPCQYPAGSQLAQAKRVLRANAGNVAFITINVGVNDVLDQCLNPRTLALRKACVDRVLPAVQTNLAQILTALREAAPGVRVAGMSYWNPFLGLWVLAGPDGEGLAREADRAFRAMNAGLVASYQDAGAAVAFVGAPEYFDIGNFTTQVSTRWGRLPLNVARTCRWTWFCDQELGPDPHPNTVGYGVVTDAFAAALHL